MSADNEGYEEASEHDGHPPLAVLGTTTGGGSQTRTTR